MSNVYSISVEKITEEGKLYMNYVVESITESDAKDVAVDAFVLKYPDICTDLVVKVNGVRKS